MLLVAFQIIEAKPVGPIYVKCYSRVLRMNVHEMILVNVSC